MKQFTITVVPGLDLWEFIVNMGQHYDSDISNIFTATCGFPGRIDTTW